MTQDDLENAVAWRDAAVLVPTYRRAGQEFLVLTVRSDRLKHHSNQIAFPGGAFDPADGDLWQTALRETEEEIGLASGQISLLKQLDTQFTPSGYRVTPYVCTIQVPEQWRLNPDEIAELFSVPVDHLRNPRNLQIQRKIYRGRHFIDPHFIYGNHVIWGMTGRIVYELLELEQQR